MSLRVDRPGRFFTIDEMAIIWHSTNMAQVRNEHRRGDDRLFQILTEFAEGAFSAMSVPGHEPQTIPDNEERSQWTVQQLARATNRTTRTITRDIENNKVEAERPGHSWVITDDAARAYIAGHRKN